MKILGSEPIELKEESCSFEIDTVQDSELQLMTDRSVHVFIRIRNAGNLKIRAAVPENEKVSIVFWNDSADPIRIKEEYEVKENAVLDLAYGECNEADMQRNIEIKLSGRKAKASISSASLVNRKKYYDM